MAALSERFRWFLPAPRVDLAHALAQVMPPRERADPDAGARAWEYFAEVADQAQQLIDVDKVLRARPANPDVLSAWAWHARGPTRSVAESHSREVEPRDLPLEL